MSTTSTTRIPLRQVFRNKRPKSTTSLSSQESLISSPSTPPLDPEELPSSYFSSSVSSSSFAPASKERPALASYNSSLEGASSNKRNSRSRGRKLLSRTSTSNPLTLVGLSGIHNNNNNINNINNNNNNNNMSAQASSATAAAAAGGVLKGTRTPQMLEYERQAEERAKELAQVEEDRQRMNEEMERMGREQERIAQEEYEMRQYYEAEALRHAEEMRLHKEEVRRHQERVKDHDRRIRDHEASSEAFAKVIVMPARGGRAVSFMQPRNGA